MFERLDQIPWTQLRQAHGHAGHVPSAVRDLMSQDPTKVDRAYWMLDNYVVLQSDLYEAAAYLPEFLIAAFDDAAPAGKRSILELMFQIGNGYAPPDVKLRYSFNESGELRHLPPGSAPTLNTVCHVAILSALQGYVDAERSDPELRAQVAAVINDLSECEADRRPS